MSIAVARTRSASVCERGCVETSAYSTHAERSRLLAEFGIHSHVGGNGERQHEERYRSTV